MCEMFDTALLMLVDNSVNPNDRELPVAMFEGDARLVEGAIEFTQTPYRIATHEAERIAVDHISHIQAGTTDPHLTSEGKWQLHGVASLFLLVFFLFHPFTFDLLFGCSCWEPQQLAQVHHHVVSSHTSIDPIS
jgi:hypothetical protein